MHTCFPKNASLGSFWSGLVSIGLMQKVGCNLKVDHHSQQHFTRSQKIASLGGPTKNNQDISINAAYDNHWCHIVTNPNNKVCVKYDPCVCFIMSTIQFVNLSMFCSAIFSCVIIAFLINGEVQLMPIKDRSIYLRGPFLVQKYHQFPFTLWWAQGTVDINWSFLWWTCDSVCNFFAWPHKSCYSLWTKRDHCRLSLSLMASALVPSRP